MANKIEISQLKSTVFAVCNEHGFELRFNKLLRDTETKLGLEEKALDERKSEMKKLFYEVGTALGFAQKREEKHLEKNRRYLEKKEKSE